MQVQLVLTTFFFRFQVGLTCMPTLIPGQPSSVATTSSKEFSVEYISSEVPPRGIGEVLVFNLADTE